MVATSAPPAETTDASAKAETSSSETKAPHPDDPKDEKLPVQQRKLPLLMLLKMKKSVLHTGKGATAPILGATAQSPMLGQSDGVIADYAAYMEAAGKGGETAWREGIPPLVWTSKHLFAKLPLTLTIHR